MSHRCDDAVYERHAAHSREVVYKQAHPPTAASDTADDVVTTVSATASAVAAVATATATDQSSATDVTYLSSQPDISSRQRATTTTTTAAVVIVKCRR